MRILKKMVILAVLWAVVVLPGKISAQGVESQEVDKDGIHYVVLENEYVKMVFIPAKGGICGKFEIKNWPGENNTTMIMENRDFPGGLFDDRFWLPQVSFAQKQYLYEIISKPNSKSLHLWTRGVGGLLFLELHKTITLYQDSNLVDVIYEFKNLQEFYTDYEVGIQFHNFLGLRQEENTYYFPMEDGVRTFRYDYASGNLPAEPKELWGTNLVEEIKNKIPFNGRRFTISLRPFQIKTFFLRNN